MAKRKGGTNWSTYPIGVIERSNLEVISVKRGKTCKETIYHVSYTCCGKEIDVNHVVLRDRTRNPRRWCPECSNKKRSKTRGPRKGLSCADHAYFRKRHVVNHGFGEHSLDNEESYDVSPPAWPAPPHLIGTREEPR